MEAHHHQDSGTLRADALAALQTVLDDPTGLDEVRVPDFDAGRPALRLRGEWVELDAPTADVLGRYVDTVRALGAGYHLFGWVDADRDGQLG
jgi:hypothetical protein